MATFAIAGREIGGHLRGRVALASTLLSPRPSRTASMSILAKLIRDLLFGLRQTPPIAQVTYDNPLIAYLEKNPQGRAVCYKWRHYFDIYHRHFARFRGEAVTMIEIGVFNGGSLRMWRDYLGSQATIVGVDVNPECARFSEPGIEIVIGDQADRDFLQSLSDRYPNFAIVLDDGGHRMHQQITSLEELYPRLRSDGVYLCEDTHTSYMPAFGGGEQQPNTFIETAKRLIDRLNTFCLENAELASNDFARITASMHFYHGVLVIEKMPQEQPAEVTYGSVAAFRCIGPSLSG